MPMTKPMKYECKECGNTFLKTTGDLLLGCDMPVCQECGGVMDMNTPDWKNLVDPAMKVKSLRHDIKCLFKVFKGR